MVIKVRKGERRQLLASMDQVSPGTSEENAAFQHVRNNIEELNGQKGVEDTDLIFLKGLMDSPAMMNLMKVQDRLEEDISTPVSLDNDQLVGDLVDRCGRARSGEARELGDLLSRPHLRALISSHDQIGQDSNTTTNTAPTQPIEVATMHGETIRMVGLRKVPKEPLGLTIQQDENSGSLIVARILGGGMIDKQGLLRIGDVILEVNGTPVYNPEQLQAEISKTSDTVTLKVGQGSQTGISAALRNASNDSQMDGTVKRLTCYMRALYDYNPTEDTLLPCREIGLPFQRGDILQIVDQKDPNWWQAKKVGGNGPAGLIPSLELEERRKAFVAPDADFVHKIGICGARVSKKKRKILYRSKSSGDFDKADLPLYEEVTRMPPFRRKTLVLVGPQGVGRRTLKNRLVNSDSEKFGAAVPHTSRPQRVLEENGRDYFFDSREKIEQDIRENRYLEYGEHNGHIYGTHLDTIRGVIRQGKMCVLDTSPVSLKVLHHSSEFLPYVIFIGAPGMEQLQTMYALDRHGYSSRNLSFDRNSSIRFSSRRARTLESLASLYEEDDLRTTVEESARIQRAYHNYIDLVIVNNDFDVTFRKVVEALDALTTDHQWVPVNWIY